MKWFAILCLLVFVGALAQSQEGPWSHFWHPRPPIVKSETAMFGASAAPSAMWLFKPTFSLIAASFVPPSSSGGTWTKGIFNGAGPALTYEYDTQQVDGTNYAEYSASLGFYLAGATNTDPNFQPAIALMGGALNNIINVGVGVHLSTPVTGASRFFLLASLGVNLFEN